MPFVSHIVFIRIYGEIHPWQTVAVGKRGACPTMTMAKLLGELFRWLRLAFRLFTGRQTPFALFAKW
jgi:hypothetical protein